MIEKLYQKQPFIYRIGDKYYAFGMHVCSECMRIVGLERDYDNYKKKIQSELDEMEAWKIFHRMRFLANSHKKEVKTNVKEWFENEFEKMNFSEDEKSELDKQVKEMALFIQKNKLMKYLM